MRLLFLILAPLLALTLSSCSTSDIDKKLDDYSAMSPEAVAIRLMNDGNYAGTVGKKIAWCQANVIVDSKLPEDFYKALLNNDGSTIVERARSLKRPGLAKKLKKCITDNTK